MNIARIPSAAMMPNSSTFCWYWAGTANRPMMIRKTNRLSTDRLFSTTQPAKYSAPVADPASHHRTSPKTTATPM